MLILPRPQVDLSRCLGCGACIAACPEERVLDMLHGQAVVVHGASCVNHGHCEEACPAGAIRLGWHGLDERRDLPALTQALDLPGYGRLKAGDYGRDELLEVWNVAVSHSGLEIAEQTRYLAVGRRGRPHQLDVPGEDLPKVRYRLREARAGANT